MNEIFERTSVRKFMDKEVESEKIEKLLKAAMAAPSAGNQQPWEFYVIKNRDTLMKLAQTSPYAGCTQDAPMAIVSCYSQKNLRFPEYAEIDLSAATENILLEAVTLSLGAVWLGIAPLKERIDQVKKVLDMPADLTPFAIIPCGYPIKVSEQQDRFDKSRVHYDKK